MLTDIVLLLVMGLLPLVFAFWFVTGAYRSLFQVSDRASDLFVGGALLVILASLLLVMPWGFSSYWLRILITALAIIGCLRWMTGRFPAFAPDRGTGGRLTQGILPVVGIIFGWLGLMGTAGLIPPRDTVSLQFPLDERAFVIGQGGGSLALNAHHESVSQAWAVDIVALTAAGRNRSGLIGGERRKEDYAIWDAPVSAPCEGEVVWARDGLEDVDGGQRSAETPAGNAVALDCGEVTVFLAHLRQGSVLVSEGQFLSPGSPIGRVGNSGNTSEPHLHIHAEDGPFKGETGSGNKGVAIRFDGNFPVRNDLFLR